MMWNLLRRLFGRDLAHAVTDEIEPPRLEWRNFGDLSVPSRRLLIADPMYVSEPVNVGPTAGITCRASGQVLAYSGGGFRIVNLRAVFADAAAIQEEPLGSVPIDSAKVVLIDDDAFRHHWTETGPDRIGQISTARDRRVLCQLERRFGLRTRQADPITAEVIGPVSAELEAEITAYLKADPKYASFAFHYFHVLTNGSFDRVNYLREEAAFIPVGNAPEPRMFACTTGYGDGTYPVSVRRRGREIAAVEIQFIDLDTHE